MFHVVGWVVVTSFALYGLAKFIEGHVTMNNDEKSANA